VVNFQSIVYKGLRPGTVAGPSDLLSTALSVASGVELICRLARFISSGISFLFCYVLFDFSAGFRGAGG
jgi:hypothetical protein